MFIELQVQSWKFQAQTWGEHVVYRNCFWHSEQFLYTTCSPHVLQKEVLLTKIYLYQGRKTWGRDQQVICQVKFAHPLGMKAFQSCFFFCFESLFNPFVNCFFHFWCFPSISLKPFDVINSFEKLDISTLLLNLHSWADLNAKGHSL